MKKFFAFLLAFAMMFSLCGVAMAAGNSDPGHNDAVSGGKTGNVVIKVTGADDVAGKIYFVEIKWGTLTFEYDFDPKAWNPSNHEYGDRTGSWVAKTGQTSNGDGSVSADITVINHSNDGVKVTAALADLAHDDKGAAKAELNKTELTLLTAEETTLANAPKGTFTVKVSGVPKAKNSADTGFQIGTITLTIEAN